MIDESTYRVISQLAWPIVDIFVIDCLTIYEQMSHHDHDDSEVEFLIIIDIVDLYHNNVVTALLSWYHWVDQLRCASSSVNITICILVYHMKSNVINIQWLKLFNKIWSYDMMKQSRNNIMNSSNHWKSKLCSIFFLAECNWRLRDFTLQHKLFTRCQAIV